RGRSAEGGDRIAEKPLSTVEKVKEESLFFFFQAEDGIRDKLVTGVQTCALPISRGGRERGRLGDGDVLLGGGAADPDRGDDIRRSEERRVGKECRSRWSPEHEKKKKTE